MGMFSIQRISSFGNNKIMKKYSKKQNKGFVILFAMLISSIILLISAGIYTVVQKQVVLASYAKESQKAFYAADAALDCALFYDISPFLKDGKTAFPPAEGSPETDIECGGGATTVRLLSGAVTGGEDDPGLGPDDQGFFAFNYPYTFRYYGVQEEDGDYIGSGCAYVLVEKKSDPATAGLVITRITAAGFNACVESTSGSGIFDQPDFDNPTLLERRVSLRYKQALAI